MDPLPAKLEEFRSKEYWDSFFRKVNWRLFPHLHHLPVEDLCSSIDRNLLRFCWEVLPWVYLKSVLLTSLARYEEVGSRRHDNWRIDHLPMI
jgi:hypothetical protein